MHRVPDREGPRSVLLCIPANFDVARIALESMLQRYRKATSYTGPLTVELHAVLRDRPVAERLSMLTKTILDNCDLVIWYASCEEVGKACKAHLEQVQGRAPDSMHHGTVTLVQASLGGRPHFYRSDLYVRMPEGSEAPST